MQDNFKELLRTADGASRHVIVVFVDVRGFSSFARIAESTDTAEFLKSAYLRILDDFFPDANFFKPTGDGLLILTGYDRENLTERIRFAVNRSIELVEAFPSICDEDPMINFEVPQHLGIGLARGSATALTAADGTDLDFSGRPLNLASRLMDLARPSGVVFDNSLDISLLEKEAVARFHKESAYVKGIAEVEPLTVFTLSGYTEVPEYNKRPMDRFVRFGEKQEKITFKEFEERAPLFRHPLVREPARLDNIELNVDYPAVSANGNRRKGMRHYGSITGEFESTASGHYALFDYTGFLQSMRNVGVKDPWEVYLQVEYSVFDEDVASSDRSDPPPQKA